MEEMKKEQPRGASPEKNLESRLSARIDLWAEEETKQRKLVLEARRRRSLRRIAVAASVAIVAGCGLAILHPASHHDTYEDPRQAYLATAEALNLLIDNLEQGREELQTAYEICNTTHEPEDQQYENH